MLRASAESFLRQSSVAARMAANESGPGFLSASEASHFCAFGLKVGGMGMTRRTCAVPSASKLAEFCCTLEQDNITNVISTAAAVVIFRRIISLLHLPACAAALRHSKTPVRRDKPPSRCVLYSDQRASRQVPPSDIPREIHRRSGMP